MTLVIKAEPQKTVVYQYTFCLQKQRTVKLIGIYISAMSVIVGHFFEKKKPRCIRGAKKKKKLSSIILKAKF